MDGVANSVSEDSAVGTLPVAVSAGIFTKDERGVVGLVACDAAVVSDEPGMTITLPELAGFGGSSGAGTGLPAGAGDFDASSVAAAIGVVAEFLLFRNVTWESNETNWI